MEGKVCPRHNRLGQNLPQRHHGRFRLLEPSLVQQSLDSNIQLLGSKEWQNNQILGGRLATKTQNGETRQGGTPTGVDHAR
jgi:hypothetical protein